MSEKEWLLDLVRCNARGLVSSMHRHPTHRAYYHNRKGGNTHMVQYMLVKTFYAIQRGTISSDKHI